MWGTFATASDGGILGANLCERPATPGTQGESCAWLPSVDGPLCVGLEEPAFAPTSADPLATWRVATGDGRVDLAFRPEGRKEVKHQLVVFGIDYFQLYGTYAGTVAGHAVNGVRGVLESMRARL